MAESRQEQTRAFPHITDRNSVALSPPSNYNDIAETLLENKTRRSPLVLCLMTGSSVQYENLVYKTNSVAFSPQENYSD
jgi:hypothetical protein